MQTLARGALPRRFSAAPRRRPQQPSFWRSGAPFIAFMLGGYLFLTQFVGGLKEHQDFRQKSSSEREYNMEEEYKVRLNYVKKTCSYLKFCRP
jgi:hypothetical protein